MRRLSYRILSIVLSVLIILPFIPSMRVQAEDAYNGEMIVYIALVASGAAAGDRGIVYNGPDYEVNTPDIIAVTATAKVGETATVSLTLPEEITRIYDIAPVVYSSGDNTAFGNVDASVSLKINNETVEVISEAEPQPPLSWRDEKSGRMTAWRLYGGIEEGGLMYVTPDAFKGATNIEYSITINSVDVLGPAYEGEAKVFIGFDGDLSESGDHGLIYNGEGDEVNRGDITAVNAMCGFGETVTVSLTLPKALHHAYLITPVIVPSDEDTEFSSVEAVVSLKIDGLSTDVGPVPVVSAWAEGIGQSNRAWRLYGGAIEDGIGYVGTGLFAGATKIEYTITLVSVYEVPEDPKPEPEPEIIPEIIDTPEPVIDTPAPVMTEIQVEEETTNEDLVRGIVLAVFAVFLIVCGAVLSREKTDKADEDTDKTPKDSDNDSDTADKETESEVKEKDSEDKKKESEAEDKNPEDKKKDSEADDKNSELKEEDSDKEYKIKDEDDVDIEEILDELEEEMPDE